MKHKIIIIGGGIAGLSAAHLLCNYPFDIEIYEREPEIGGQASSKFSKLCYTEYSWRIFGSVYHNLMYIINQIGAEDNFNRLLNPCLVSKNDISSANINSYNLAYQIWKESDFDTINKMLGLLFLCRERAINDFDDISAYEYFNKNQIMQTILGPFLGLEANKISLSAFMKNIYSTSDIQRYPFSPEGTLISKYPTQQSLFDPWKEYLLKKGVKIYTDSPLNSINCGYNKIDSVIIKGVIKKADDYIFACSLNTMLQLCNSNPYLHQCPSICGLKYLVDNLQLYFTINLYFSEELGCPGCDRTVNDYCSEFIIVDMPWKPIIQKKRLWKDNYLMDCDPRIKDVWNVGFLDYNPGVINKKILRDCSKEEAIEEGLYQIKNSKYIQELLHRTGRNFDDILIGIESWYQFKNDDNGKLISLNPKFSINQNTSKLMPSSHPKDLPKNMFLAGYYVQSTMGGISMESSCETGLCAAQDILNKYQIPNTCLLPIKHENEFLTTWSFPLVMTDKVLHKLGLSPITNYVPSTVLLIIYVLIIIIAIYFLIRWIFKSN